MKHKNLALTCGLLLGLAASTQADALSTNFIARGFQSCTKNCTGGKIDCLNNDDKQAGSYAWCKACDYEGKSNRQAIKDALQGCEAPRKKAKKEQDEALARAYQREHEGSSHQNPTYGNYRYN